MVRIVVVGGGSAGWTTASYIKNSIDCELTVIHEEQNNPIGVGETVTPTLRLIAENANIPENVSIENQLLIKLYIARIHFLMIFHL